MRREVGEKKKKRGELESFDSVGDANLAVIKQIIEEGMKIN